jgi:hypothetical protein
VRHNPLRARPVRAASPDGSLARETAAPDAHAGSPWSDFGHNIDRKTKFGGTE